MPIDYKKYPTNWKEIRLRILQRANNKCECCGLKNKEIVSSYIENGKRVWKKTSLGEWYRLLSPKQVTVVLTIAHLDHDEWNHSIKDERLKAMCQLCHFKYDAKENQRRRMLKNQNV